MYLEADFKWKKGRAKKESWIAPRKKSRAKRRKIVAPKKKKKKKKKKTQSRQGKKVVPKKKKETKKKKRSLAKEKKSRQKKKINQIASKKISRQGKIYSRIYMCVAPIFVSWFELVRIWSMQWKVKSESVWCFIKVHSNFASFLVSFHGRFLAPKINFEFCDSRADRVD